MYPRHLLVAALLTPLPGVTHALTPCQVDGKLIYTRECMARQQTIASDALHHAQNRAIEALSPAVPSCAADSLQRAVTQDDAEALRRCGMSDALLQSRDRNGRSLLHTAAIHGSAQALAYLLSTQPPLDGRSSKDHGGTALHLAAGHNHERLVRMLQAAGADLEARDYLKRTPLHLASSEGADAALRTLIRLRADIHAVDRAGRTALLAASQRPGNAGIIATLLDAGIDINRSNSRNMTALHYAVLTDPASTELLINRGANLNLRDADGRSALLLAAESNVDRYWRSIRLLIEAGADLNVKDKQGNTLLRIAYNRQHEALLKLLLRYGVDSHNVTTIIREYEQQAES